MSMTQPIPLADTKPKHHWKVPSAVGVGALILGTMIGAASGDGEQTAAAPLSAVTQTIKVPTPAETIQTPGPTVTKRVEVKVPGPTKTITVTEPGGGPGSQDGDMPPALQQAALNSVWDNYSKSERREICDARNALGEDLAVDTMLESAGPGFSKSIALKFFREKCD